jgi:predicted ATPase
VGAERRLVPLVGPPGLGKTWLVGELAGDLLGAAAIAERGADAEAMKDGIWLIDASAVTDAETLSERIAAQLGLEGIPTAGSGASPIDGLIGRMRSRRAILILDGCTRPVVRAVVDRLLADCRHLRIIATARAPLAVADEQLYPVGGLAYPPDDATENLRSFASVELFLRSARQGRVRAFDITAATSGPAARICRRLRGWPLAIKIAAGRVGTMDLEQLAEHLMDVVGRELDAILELTSDGLDADQRALLSRLSVFRGGWERDAAHVVAGARCAGAAADGLGATLSALADLVGCTLVEYHFERARYDMLEPVASFWRKRGGAEDIAAAEEAHTRYFTSLARSAADEFEQRKPSRSTVNGWLECLQAEMDNMRAVLARLPGADERRARLVADLHWLWYFRGPIAEGRRLIEGEMEARRGDDLLHARLLNAAGMLDEASGKTHGAEERYLAALAIVRRLGERRRAAGVLTNLGTIAQVSGRLDLAEARHAEALEGYRQLGDAWGVAVVQLNLAWLAIERRDDDAARKLLDSCRPVFEQSGDDAREAMVFNHLGELAFRRGAIGEAAAHVCRSIRIRHRFGDRRYLAWSVVWRGIVLVAQQEWEGALRLFAAADAHVVATKAALPQRYTDLQAEAAETARRQVGAERAAAASSAGSRMSCHEMVSAALEGC